MFQEKKQVCAVATSNVRAACWYHSKQQGSTEDQQISFGIGNSCVVFAGENIQRHPVDGRLYLFKFDAKKDSL